MLPGFPHGLFFRDTRFLSELCLRVNGQWPEPLAARAIDPFSAAFVLRDQPPAGLADSHLMVFRHRYVGRGMREDITVRNYGLEPAFCSLELSSTPTSPISSRSRRAAIEKVGDLHRARRATPAHLDLPARSRSRAARTSTSPQPPHSVAAHAAYEVIVPPGGEWSTCMQLTPVIDDEEITPRYLCGRPVERSTPVDAARGVAAQPADDHDATTTASRALLDRSTEDLAALRIFDPEYPDRAVVAAGAPWFMTLFGRDSLLTSWMAMLVDSDLALGTLQTLARFQGDDVNPVTEEEPGRILHEMRFGESAALSLGGGRIYYGSVDATPLFVMLLGELQRWGNRREEVDALLPAADRALAWIDEFGDRDGDGYVEYQRTSDRGLAEPGLEGLPRLDALRRRPARRPADRARARCRATCTRRCIARAHFADEKPATTTYAARLRRARPRPEAPVQRATSGSRTTAGSRWASTATSGRSTRSTSNMGHCLWTGIVDEDKARARRGAARCPTSMFSRLGHPHAASSMTGYNPLSYHSGSVWPHDNAICAAGLMRYGFVDEAHRVMRGHRRRGGVVRQPAPRAVRRPAARRVRRSR